MKTNRPLRVGSVIQVELGKMIERDLDVPAGNLITVTDVEVSADLERAKVWVSVFSGTDDKVIMVMLKKMRGDFQHLLNKKLNIKPMPRIEFFPDYGPAKAAEVEKLLLKK